MFTLLVELLVFFVPELAILSIVLSLLDVVVLLLVPEEVLLLRPIELYESLFP